MRQISVIGAGEVLREKYLSGLAEDGGIDIRVTDVLDIRPAETVENELSGRAGAEGLRIHTLWDSSSDGLVRLLKDKGLLSQSAVVATPTKFHVGYAMALLAAGMQVGIEKPYASSVDEVRLFDGYLTPPAIHRLFLFGYYLLEKGLPLTVLGRHEQLDEAYSRLIEPPMNLADWRDLRKELGPAQSIRAILLEGGDASGRLDERLWVLNPNGGGNTVETFYHLICLAFSIVGFPCSWKIRRAVLKTHRETAAGYKKIHGIAPAETLTASEVLLGDRVEARFLCAKYVLPNMRQRWVEVEFDRGRVQMNLETGVLTIFVGNRSLAMRLKYTRRYATQFRLFSAKLKVPELPIEYALMRDALVLTFQIRDKGLAAQIGVYDSEEVAPASELWP